MASQVDKWEGKATARLHKPTSDQVWPLLEDFFGLHKWLPAIDTCRRVEDDDQGQLRYCAMTLPPPTEGGGEGVVRWCHEKLVDIDPVEKRLSYRVLDNNMGLKGYESTIKVSSIDGGDGNDDDLINGCIIEWSFRADPIEGLSCGDLVDYLDNNLRGMAQNMEQEFLDQPKM